MPVADRWCGKNNKGTHRFSLRESRGCPMFILLVATTNNDNHHRRKAGSTLCAERRLPRWGARSCRRTAPRSIWSAGVDAKISASKLHAAQNAIGATRNNMSDAAQRPLYTQRFRFAGRACGWFWTDNYLPQSATYQLSFAFALVDLSCAASNSR